MAGGRGITGSMLARFRNYAVDEPSYTLSFAEWDLKRLGTPMSSPTIRAANDVLVERGIVKLVEDGGRMGKVYAYDPPKAEGPGVRRLFPELDESRIGVGSEAPSRGVVVPHTRPRGPSGKPGNDKARSARGVRVKRQRQGT